MKLSNKIFLTTQIKDDDKTTNVWFIISLNKLLKQDLDVKLSYSLLKFYKELQDKEEVFNEAKAKILEKFGTKEGNGYIISKENVEGANNEFKSLLEIEEEYSIEKFKLPEDIKISAWDIIQLELILQE